MLFYLLLACCLIEICVAHHNCGDLDNDCAQCLVEKCRLCRLFIGLKYSCNNPSDGCPTGQIPTFSCPTATPNLNTSLPCSEVIAINYNLAERH